MATRRKPEFALTSDLEKFKYEVAEEISINNKRNKGIANLLPSKAETTEK